MTTITIPLSKSIIEKIEGKTIKESNLNQNGDLELKIEECEFWDNMVELKQEIDEGKGIEVDVDKLEKHFL
ncbi:hypothetical protein [Methanobrevibacter curvatus]|jgi:hypothetical protein|uniref:Uncharacterized protein n=1 Tax=Methanobrevibacter curvatus TaxID=49547 RepID=A0A162FNM4_9EURY|nr:hypothetical protein [Methanobrevibacter curvatus]KZX12770.1 hypothetical protein MBCUR_09120 [Methanobrevibacter curvatus]MDR3063015.1 hypothetical protein [Methanobrevibacter sp.]